MKDIYQVLREKELAVLRVRREIEALRFCLGLLAEPADPRPDAPPARPAASTSNSLTLKSKPSALPPLSH